MARTRDIVVGVIIVGSFLIAFLFFAIAWMGIVSESDGLDIAGFGGSVGVIELFGIIDETKGREVVNQLKKWTESGSIEAVVLHINSPGGGVAISQEVYDATLRLREKKPVVAAMASVAASGGYYVACAADLVVANPGTITGSIGVIFQFHTYTDLMGKIGIGTETIKSGELKDVGSYSRAMTRKEELMLKAVVMDSYEQFVEVVAEARDKEIDDVKRLADGSIYTGMQAYNLGLVDTLGGLHEAVELAAELAGMGSDPHITRPYRRERAGIWDLLGSIFLKLDQKLSNSSGGPSLLYLYQ